MFAVDLFNALVFYGQTAVLAVGRATDGAEERKLAWFSLAVIIGWLTALKQRDFFNLCSRRL
jgi:hypothetical protein